MKKKILNRQTFGFSHNYYDLDGKMEDVIKKLNTYLLEAEAAGYSNIKMDWSSGYSSDDVSWSVVGDREETDKEYESRIQLEERWAKQRKKDKVSKEERERKEYERLKKKFEKKDRSNV